MEKLKEINKLGDDFFQNGLIGSLIYIIFLILLAIIIYQVIKKVIKRKNIDNASGILNIIKGFIGFLVSYASIMQITVFQSFAQTLLASGGVLAIIVGVAAQDTVGNLISGIMIIIFKPFVIGDLIKLNGEQLIGFVEEITLRHTIIKTYENNRIIVPNSEINKAKIENANLIDSTKGNYFKVCISYESNIDKAVQIIKEEVIKHPEFLDTRTEEEIERGVEAVAVRFIDFADSGIVLRCTINSKDSFEGFAMLSDLRFSIKKRFDKEHIEIPYPHITITKRL